MGGAGERAFCAGGDVAALALQNKEGRQGQQKSSDYFALEYKLDHLIATYPKPYVAYMDGITMGGGVGLSVHAPFRIATERTVFAMPETTIGFFPDVGGTFFLPRLDGNIGKYLALTSERLKGVNVFYAGIATHYVHSSTLGDLTARLSELRFEDHFGKEQRLELVKQAIEEFSITFPTDERPIFRRDLRSVIDYCFGQDTVEEIIQSLQKVQRGEGEFSQSQWATDTLKSLSERSPTSLKVTARQMAAFKETDIAEVFRREHQLASRFMAHPDFTEGVMARLVEKRAPRWRPETLEEVTNEDIDKMFLTEGEPLELLSPETYTDYPAATSIGLPREADIAHVVKQNRFSSLQQAVLWYNKKRGDEFGLKEKIEDSIRRIAVLADSPEGPCLQLRADVEEQEKAKQKAKQQRQIVVEKGDDV